jgi:hypothetical protein
VPFHTLSKTPPFYQPAAKKWQAGGRRPRRPAAELFPSIIKKRQRFGKSKSSSLFPPFSVILTPCRKGSERMKRDTGFWFGMGAGLTAGVALGVLLPCGGRSMRTQVGKQIQRLGVAVDHTVDGMISRMR